jgi:hypothetical protein
MNQIGFFGQNRSFICRLAAFDAFSGYDIRRDYYDAATRF